jgi:hypothetical protein
MLCQKFIAVRSQVGLAQKSVLLSFGDTARSCIYLVAIKTHSTLTILQVHWQKNGLTLLIFLVAIAKKGLAHRPFVILCESARVALN